MLVAIVAVLVAFAVLPPFVEATSAQPAEQQEEFVEVGAFDRMPADAVARFGSKIAVPFNTPQGLVTGTFLALHEARQLWQVFPYTSPLGTAVAVRDMSSLRIVATFELSTHLRRGGVSAFGGEWMAAIDGDRRAFVVDGANTVHAVDLRTFSTTRFTMPPGLQTMPLGGITYDPFGDRLILAFGVLGSFSVLNATTLLAAVDLGTGTVHPLRPVRSCNAALPSTEGNFTSQVAPYVANERYVYVPCQRAGQSGAVVRLDRGSVTDPASAETVAVGPTNLETAIVDRGSGRIFMPTQRGDVWVFDTATMAFVGVVGTNADRAPSTALGYGIDPPSGRLFFQSPTFGLGVADGRFSPVPQARIRRDLAANGQETIVSDAVTNRLYVLRGRGSEKERRYHVYRPRPAPVPPPSADPDANTSDQPEVTGLTESRYNAAAGGYGARVLLANGVATVAPAPAVGDLAPTADFLRNTFNAKCGFSDRELVAARVTKTEADTGSAAAEAAAVVIDPRTRLDLDRPSRCEPYGSDGSSDRLEQVFATAPEPYDNTGTDSRWNREPATCSTSVGDAPVEAYGDDHGAPPLGSARVLCPNPGEDDVVATARTALVGAVSVGRAEARTTISRGTGRIRSWAEAVTADVSIGDGIRIGEIRSVAVSQSTGRPADDPLSTHAVTIRDVTISGVDVCGVCEPTQALDALNRALSGRAEFRFGADAADAGLLRGSPRGAVTAVQKSVERQVSDRSLVGDFTIEIPALELVVYNDNSRWGRGRQLYQFAGVTTSATYNIVPVPALSDGDDDSAEDPPGDHVVPVDTVDAGDVGAAPSAVLDVESSAGAKQEGSAPGLFQRVGRALAAVGRGLRLFVSDPRHGLAILTGWALLGLPAVLFRRRLTVAGPE